MRHSIRRQRGSAAARGVSIVEAIVAMAVMAFGMMAIVGLQTTLRLNSDVAKQRSEAVRIAQEAIEEWRAFATMPTTAGMKAYDDIPLGGLPDKAVSGDNAVFTLKRTITPGEGWKSIQVVVEWKDRSGQDQSITLNSLIGQTEPALSGILSLLPAAVATRQPLGRNPAIPAGATPIDGDRSIYRPPGAPDTAVWVFDNLSGMITSVCSFPADGNPADLVNTENCFEQAHWLITGFVRFSFASPPNAARPTDLQIPLGLYAIAVGVEFGNGECFAAPVEDPKLTYTSYVCRVPQSADTTWTGSILLGPPLDLDLYDVCRYSNGEPGNINHPRVYTGLDRSLVDQNMLVITQGVTCPSGTRRLQPPEALPPPLPS